MNFIKLRSATSNSYVDESLKVSRLNPVIAYDKKNKFYALDENFVGLFYVCTPTSFYDRNIMDRLKSLLNHDFPATTAMQFMLFKSPDINRQMFDMLKLRDKYNDKFHYANMVARKDFLTSHTANPLITRNQNTGEVNLGLINDVKLLISVKFPIKGLHPTKEEVKTIKEWDAKINASLRQLNLHPNYGTPTDYIRVMNTLINWGEDTAWRKEMIQYDENEPINEQIFDYDKQLDINDKFLKIGEQYIACLSAKNLPSVSYFGDAMACVGVHTGQPFNLKENYAVVANVVWPDQNKKQAALDRLRKYAVNQADGPIERYVPILGDKKRAFDTIYGSIQEGNKIVELSYTVMLFAPSEDALNSAIIAAQSHWSETRFTIMQDRFQQLPMFVNCLPLCTDVAAQKELFRYKTITSEQSVPILPIMGEWKGTGTPHVNLISRNGQLMSMSLHGAGTNNNAVIAAQSGSGKSFLVNEIIISYLSEGAQVWVIDVGRSYEKLCETLNGDFVHFANDSDITLNPFKSITDFDEDQDTLLALILAMASPKGSLDELQEAKLGKIVRNLYYEKGDLMTIDDIADNCLKDEDSRIVDIGSLLNAFTRSGNYGKYFEDRNTIKFDNKFTVLELDDLQGRQHLRQVVLLQLIFQIQQAVYFGDRSVKKLVVIDEAWDLLSSGETAKFLEHAYRKFRKYGGSVLISTQSINDLYSNPHGQAIAENSASMYLLGQKAESIESIKASNRLSINPGAYEVLKTVHTLPGVYSEIFLYTGEAGMGIGRLVVGDYQKLLYSTAPQDIADIKSYTDQGYTTDQAIQQVIADRNA